jgi:hypothetical protein
MSTKSIKRRVAPLEQLVRPEGTSRKKSTKRRVAPLEHIVHPEGHVAQGKQNEASDTLGEPSAS